MASLDTETVDPNDKGARAASAESEELVLTVLGHPDVARVGEIAILEPRSTTMLSRTTPAFSRPGAGDRYPLADPAMSRRAIHLAANEDGSVSISKIEGGSVSRDGSPVTAPAKLERGAVDAGVVLSSGTTVLLLHRRKSPRLVVDSMGLVGDSSALHTLRNQIAAIADFDVPVLLRGETGTGKDLVARAIHAVSRRKDAPYFAINMAAIQPTIAAAELFGYRKGSFTGAERDRDGIFRRAHGGTLFLDEIGETPAAIQAMLLRTLETGTIQPVGGDTEEPVDVRLICATDMDLDAAAKSGGFRAPLLYRIAGYELSVPPLRSRRDDIGRLLVHFIRDDVRSIPAETIIRLALYDWPGNIRQLKNVARQLVIAEQSGESSSALVPMLESERPEPEPERADTKKRAAGRKPREITEDELAKALAGNRWNVEATATELSISRTSLYAMIEKSGRFRKAKDIDRDELMTAHAQAGGDFERMSELLRVSSAGLRLRMKEVLGES